MKMIVKQIAITPSFYWHEYEFLLVPASESHIGSASVSISSASEDGKNQIAKLQNAYKNSEPIDISIYWRDTGENILPV